MISLTTINETDPVQNAPAVINGNFAALNSGKLETLTNDGSGTGQLVEAASGQNVNIKTIKAGTNISVTNNTSDVTITANAPNADASTTVKGLGRTTVNPSVNLGNPTITLASPAVITLTGHGLTADDTVVFSTTGALPTGITAATTYYVISSGLTSNAFEISTTQGGGAVNTSGSQSGTHTVVKTTPIFVEDADPRLPTQNENNALVGTSGTPVSSSNKLVDNADTGTSGAGKVLRLDGSGKLPALDGSQLTNLPTQPNSNVTTHNIATTGAQTIAHGLGVTPKYIRITLLSSQGSALNLWQSIGTYNGTTTSIIFTSANLNASNTGLVTPGESNSYIASYNDSSGNSASAVPTVDGTNITLTWSKSGTPTGTVQILWEAFP